MTVWSTACLSLASYIYYCVAWITVRVILYSCTASNLLSPWNSPWPLRHSYVLSLTWPANIPARVWTQATWCQAWYVLFLNCFIDFFPKAPLRLPLSFALFISTVLHACAAFKHLLGKKTSKQTNLKNLDTQVCQWDTITGFLNNKPM